MGLRTDAPGRYGVQRLSAGVEKQLPNTTAGAVSWNAGSQHPCAIVTAGG